MPIFCGYGFSWMFQTSLSTIDDSSFLEFQFTNENCGLLGNYKNNQLTAFGFLLQEGKLNSSGY